MYMLHVWRSLTEFVVARPLHMLYRCSRQFYFVQADVATEEGCSTLASEADRLMGCIDGLVSISSATKLCGVSCGLVIVLPQPSYVSLRVAHGSTLSPSVSPGVRI